MEGFITLDTLYLHVKYPKRDIFDEYFKYVSSLDTRILKKGFVLRDFVIKTGSSGYKISVWQHDARVFLTNQVDEICGDGMGMGIWVQLGPKFLMENINNLQAAVHDFLFAIGLNREYPISITRIDLAIDLLGVSMSDQDIELWKNGWVGRSKISKVFFNTRTSVLESIYIGSRNSAILLRLYDKVAQSIVDSDYQYWLDVWKGYQGDVTRIEWEVKTKEGNFADDQKDFSKFNGFSFRELLNYLLNWGRLCIPDDSDCNRNRWENAPLWAEIRELVATWAEGIDWPTSRYGKAFHGISEAYIKFLSGTIAGGMARLQENDPSLYGLIDGLKKYGEDVDVIVRKAKGKAAIIKRL